MKEIIHTPSAPAALGPYNQATVFSNVIFTAGQIALDPASGELIEGNIEDETHRVLKNLEAILVAAGSGLQHVLSTTVYVSDMENYSRINAVYAQYFPEETAPARALVEVTNLPKYVGIEISAIAIRV